MGAGGTHCSRARERRVAARGAGPDDASSGPAPADIHRTAVVPNKIELGVDDRTAAVAVAYERGLL